MRQGSGPIQPPATASRRPWEGSTPIERDRPAAASPSAALEAGALVTYVLGRPSTAKCNRGAQRRPTGQRTAASKASSQPSRRPAHSRLAAVAAGAAATAEEWETPLALPD